MLLEEVALPSLEVALPLPETALHLPETALRLLLEVLTMGMLLPPEGIAIVELLPLFPDMRQRNMHTQVA